MEKDIIPKQNIPFEKIEIYGFNRKNLFKNFKTLKCFYKAIKKCKKLIKDFNPDILGVKTYYLPYSQVLNEFDNLIALEKNQPYKYYLMSEKAAYQLKNKDYKSAYATFNYLINLYEKGTKVFFSPSLVYNNRAIARNYLGDKSGAKSDFVISRKMCPECKFNLDSTMIKKP